MTLFSHMRRLLLGPVLVPFKEFPHKFDRIQNQDRLNKMYSQPHHHRMKLYNPFNRFLLRMCYDDRFLERLQQVHYNMWIKASHSKWLKKIFDSVRTIVFHQIHCRSSLTLPLIFPLL